MDRELIGKNLRFLRKTSKMKMIDFSEKMNSSISTIQYYERGNVSVESLIRYKKEFNVSLDDLCFKNLSKFGIEN